MDSRQAFKGIHDELYEDLTVLSSLLKKKYPQNYIDNGIVGFKKELWMNYLKELIEETIT